MKLRVVREGECNTCKHHIKLYIDGTLEDHYPFAINPDLRCRASGTKNFKRIKFTAPRVKSQKVGGQIAGKTQE